MNQQRLQEPLLESVDDQIIRERNDEMRGLVRDLTDLREAMGDISVLVDTQGQDLNAIEGTAHEAEIYVEQGVTDLHSAKRYQSSYRKKICVIIIIVIIILAILTVVLLVVFKDQLTPASGGTNGTKRAIEFLLK